MTKIRHMILVFGAVLLLFVTAAFQADDPPAVPSNASYSSAGMGDLRRYEAQPSISNTGAQETGVGSVGMGELRRVESMPSIPNTGAQVSTSSYAGMGDLRRFEAQQ